MILMALRSNVATGVLDVDVALYSDDERTDDIFFSNALKNQ